MNTLKRTISLLIIGSAWLCCSHAADWPTFRGNMGRTGFYPDAAGFPSGAPVWKLSLECEIISSPVVADGMLYIGARDSCIYCVSAATGSVLWKKKTGGWVDASPLVSADRVIAGSRDSTIYILDRKNGNVLGLLAAGVQLSSPAMSSGGSIVSGLGLFKGGVASYDAGPSPWQRTEQQWSIPLPQFTYSSPAVYGQAVVIGATDGKLYGIDIDRKDTIWSLQTGGLVYLSTPAIDETAVYFSPGDEDRNVYAADLLTGRVLWKSAGLPPMVDTLGMLAKKKSARVLVPAELDQLLRLSPSARKQAITRYRGLGLELPRVPLAMVPGRKPLAKTTAGTGAEFIPLGGMKTSSVAVGPENVYVVQKELGYILTNDSLVDFKQQFSIQTFNKHDGTPGWSTTEWRSSPRLGYCSSPVVTRNIVFVGWGEGRIYGFDARSGEKLWEDSLQGHIISSPAIAAGKLFAATMDGNLYAYALTATAPGLDFAKSTYCYPNPARDVSHIQVYVNREADISMTIYTLADQPVLRVTKRLGVGKHPFFDWNLSGVANGVYLARIKASYVGGGDEKKVLKIAVLK